MKRCMLGAAILVAVNYGLASADYVIVKIDLNHFLHSANQPPPPPPGPGTPGQFMPGVPPGYRPPAMPPTGGKGGGGRGGKGGRGGGGFAPPAYPPGYNPGQPYPNQFGGPQGQPGAMPGQPGARPPEPTGPEEPPLYIYAYIETKSAPRPAYAADKNVPFNIYEVDCKWGDQKVKLFVPSLAISYESPNDLFFKSSSLAKKFKDKFQVELKDGTEDSKMKKLHVLGEWALQRGLFAEFDQSIEELKKLDPKNAVVAAVEKTRGQLKNKPNADDPAAKSLQQDLRKEGYRQLAGDGGHYTMLTNIPASGSFDEELKKKLTRMEEVYNTFFLWYALKGQPLTPPPYRLVVVMIDTPSGSTKVFQSKHAAFNFVPMVGGGFTAQRDNVLVMASRRMDEAFDKLNEYNQSKWEDYNTSQNELLTNVAAFLRNPKVLKGQQSGKPAVAVLSMMQTFALCQKAMNDESELVALTHGGVRQLLAATGIMPRNVDTGEWVRFGLASYFEVPMQSFHPSTGGPNWAHLVEFKALRRAKVLESKDAKDILLKVIGDQYFHQAYATLQRAELANKEDRDDIRHKGQDELALARATSWSLTYYLARHKNPALERYLGELRSLPRDLDYDSKILRDCFYRAFGLLTEDPDNPGRPMVKEIDLERLAADWFAFMDKSPDCYLDVQRYEDLAVQWRLDDLKAAHAQPAGNVQQRPGGQPPTGVQPGTGNRPGVPGRQITIPPVQNPTGKIGNPPVPPGKGG